MYLDRIEAYDQQSGLNAFVVLNPNALSRADELDAEFPRTRQLRPLHGIPAVVKDNYDTRDLQTAGGSLALKGSLPPDDAFQIQKIREAGRSFSVGPMWRNWLGVPTSRSVPLMALPGTRMT